jgi:hypothetical protein
MTVDAVTGDRLGRSGESSTKLKIIRYQLVAGAASFVRQPHRTLDEPIISLCDARLSWHEVQDCSSFDAQDNARPSRYQCREICHHAQSE